MAHITTTYKPELAELIGSRTEEYEASTIKEVLKQMKERHGKEVYKDAKARLITINEKSIQALGYLKAPLKDGDVVGFYPLAAGG